MDFYIYKKNSQMSNYDLHFSWFLFLNKYCLCFNSYTEAEKKMLSTAEISFFSPF